MSYTEVIFSFLKGLQKIGVLKEKTATSQSNFEQHAFSCLPKTFSD
jgi:hypothetical protein